MKISIRNATYSFCLLLICLGCVKETRFFPEEESLKILSSISTIESRYARIQLQASFKKKRFVEITEFGFVLSKSPIVINKDTITIASGLLRKSIFKGTGVLDTITSDEQLLYKSVISNLEIGQKYYIRSYLRVGQNKRCGYSDEISIVTPQLPDEITINDYTWKRDNLNTDKFRSGKPIYFAKNINAWDSICNLGKPAYCYYNFGNNSQYGKLYNYWAMKGDTLTASGAVNFDEIAPIGWHVANSNEFETLININKRLLISNVKWAAADSGYTTNGLDILPGVFYDKTDKTYSTGFSNSSLESNNGIVQETSFWSDHSWNFGWEAFKIKRNSEVFSSIIKNSDTDELSVYLEVKNHAYYIRLIKNKN